MVNRDRSLIQLEVDLQNGTAVAGYRCAPSLVLAFIKDVLRRFFRRLVIARHLNRSAGLGLTRCGQGIVLSVSAVGILIIELNLVVDVLRFPHSEHGVIRSMLISGHMRCFSGKRFIRVELAVCCIVVDKRRNALRPVGRIVLPVRRSFRRIADLYAGPALELIADFSLCGLNLNSLIDLEVVVGVERSRAVVLEPLDMGEDFLILLDIDCLQTNGIDVLLARIRIGFIYGITSVLFGDLCIGIVNHECFTGEYLVSGSIVGSIPLLKLPVTEHIIFLVRGLGGRSRNGLSAIHIIILVLTNIAALADVIDHVDARGANQLAAPLGVEIHFADRGRVTRINFVRGIEFAVFGDHGRIGDKRVETECLGIFLIRIPTGQLEIDPGAAEITDHVAVIDIEGIFAIIGICTHVTIGKNNWIITRIVGENVDLVLTETPLGIQRHVVRRHLVKDDRIARAVFVVVPAKEHEAVQRRLGIISGDIRFIIDVVLSVKRSALDRSFNRITAAIYKDTVIVDNVILVAGVAEIKIVIISD